MSQHPALPEPNDEDRRQHLGFIQAVITRMSAASSTAKGWLLPVVTATYGYALTKHNGSIALLGVVGVALFAMLDANYLRQEQAYRRLYDTVARKARPVPAFSLDPSEAFDPPAMPPKKVREWGGRWIPAANVWLSWSIAPFYGGLLVVGLLIGLRA
ncbi:MAG: hypothetical protein ACRDPS_03505 [Nocardioides sp.]|uniref:hypothetical protein n=1 Tax=Nocardioides sp. TaxID=35761 RepID=UPI003D6B52CD